MGPTNAQLTDTPCIGGHNVTRTTETFGGLNWGALRLSIKMADPNATDPSSVVLKQGLEERFPSSPCPGLAQSFSHPRRYVGGLFKIVPI